jgi:hypothetical protein
MKKFIITMLVCFMAAVTFAQDKIVSKNGYVVLPEKGDLALGFDGVPVLNFALNAVNIMSNTGNTASHPGYVNGMNQVLVGKYFLKDNLAVRGRLGINTTSTLTKFYFDNPLTPSATDPENILIQKTRVNNNAFFLGAGLEWRRGHNRLQGFYGGEILIGMSNTTTKNSYEIEYNQEAQDSGVIGLGDSRVLSNKAGTSITLGVRGFAGVEYFIFPKISIGAEFGWGLGFSTTPRGKLSVENWSIAPGETDPSASVIETQGNSSSNSFGFQVDNGINSALGASGALNIIFHF